jgi:CubicO group peptidase (beta-lactamase class C family)
VRGDDGIFARGFGVADIEKKTPVTPDTSFLIGSATKAFTATLVGCWWTMAAERGDWVNR